MKVLYYDCFSGISGDMNLGAMVDLGVDEKYLREELDKLDVKGWELKVEPDQRHGIFGTKVTVVQTNGDQTHRHLADIERIIYQSALSERVKQISIKIFKELAIAEAKVHRVPYERVHFHEVGAVDSIVDIIGAAICFDSLNVDEVHVSTIELGSGAVQCAHGLLPVPAPATAELVKDIPVTIGGVDFEATTPTGAAIVKVLGTTFGGLPEFRIVKTGYGVGHKENPERPNLLRVYLAEKSRIKQKGSRSFLVECNIDDMNPEWFDNLMNRLLDAGASDVFFTSIMMKKNRPATKVSVVSREELLEEIKDTLFSESTTLGVRVTEFEKSTLDRKFVELDTPLGKVGIRYAYYNGRRVSAKPEYRDCIDLARANDLTLREVYRIIEDQIFRADSQAED